MNLSSKSIKKIKGETIMKRRFTLMELLVVILVKGVADYGELAEKCDQDRGYTCTHYDIRQFSLGK